MSTDISAVGSAGQEERVTLRLRGSVGPKGRSLLFSLLGNLDRGCCVGSYPYPLSLESGDLFKENNVK